MVAIFTILGAYQTIQQQWFSTWPVSLPFPLWAWLLIAIVVLLTVLEGAYRRIMTIQNKLGVELLDKLDIEVNEVKIEPNGIVGANILLKPSRKMELSKIILNCDYKQIEGLIRNNKLPHHITSKKNGIIYDVEFKFFENVSYAKAWEVEEEERITYGQERRVVADSRVWPSNTFAIPTKIKESPFVLQHRINRKGELTLVKESNTYKMVLPMSVEFSNMDTRYPISIYTYARIFFDTFLQDGHKESYVLQNQNNIETIKLEPNEKNREVPYEFVAKYNTEPALGETARCQLSDFAITNTLKYRNLPQLKTDPFEVKVVHK